MLDVVKFNIIKPRRARRRIWKSRAIPCACCDVETPSDCAGCEALYDTKDALLTVNMTTAGACGATSGCQDGTWSANDTDACLVNPSLYGGGAFNCTFYTFNPGFGWNCTHSWCGHHVLIPCPAAGGGVTVSANVQVCVMQRDDDVWQAVGALSVLTGSTPTANYIWANDNMGAGSCPMGGSLPTMKFQTNSCCTGMSFAIV